jgi:hypothetical protein
MSTAVVGIAGTASAAPWEMPAAPFTFSTEIGADVDYVGSYLEIQSDTPCTITWQLDGAAGGAGKNGTSQAVPGSQGGRYVVTTDADDTNVFQLYPGTAGTDAPLDGGTSGHGGTNGAEYADGQNGTYDGSTYGGGGGAASIVTLGGEPFLGAFGGDGGLVRNQDGFDGGVGGLDNEYLDESGSIDVDGSGTAETQDGVISGAVTCTTEEPTPVLATAPGAPALQDYPEVGDGTAKVRFTPGANSNVGGISWKYQLDGGAWTAFTPGYTNNDDLTLSLSALTNLKTYQVAVRGVVDGVEGAPSAAVSFTPFRPVDAPASVSATVGVSSVRISWTPAVDASGTVKYTAFATPEGAQSSSETVECTTADASATSCVVGVKPGRTYWYGVVGVDAGNNEGEFLSAEGATAVVPGPTAAASLPKADGTLTSNATNGRAAAGGQVTISGTGFLPGSTVALVVYSTPVNLGEAVVLADGTFSATVTLPKNMVDGTHHLVATGVDANGNTRNLVVEVTVSGGTAVLASTGFSALPYAGAGALALLAGGGFLVAARRRTAA